MNKDKKRLIEEYYKTFYSVFDPMQYGVEFYKMYVERNKLLYKHLLKYNELVEAIGERKAMKIKKKFDKHIESVWRSDKI